MRLRCSPITVSQSPTKDDGWLDSRSLLIPQYPTLAQNALGKVNGKYSQVESFSSVIWMHARVMDEALLQSFFGTRKYGRESCQDIFKISVHEDNLKPAMPDVVCRHHGLPLSSEVQAHMHAALSLGRLGRRINCGTAPKREGQIERSFPLRAK